MAKGTLKQKQQRQDKEKQAYAFYVAQGWTPEQSIGIIGNIKRESGFNPNAIGDAGKAFGLAQWHPDRQAKAKSLYGNNWKSFENQLKFIDWELKNTEKVAGDKLKKTKGVWQAGQVVSDFYERPKVKFSGDETRQTYVADLAMKFKGVKLTPEDMPYFDASYANSVAPYMNQSQETVTPNLNYFGISKETPTFASVPDSAEEKTTEKIDKDVEEVETKTKEYNFLEALQNLSKEDYTHLQPEQVAQQQTVPQVDFNQQFEQVSQFIDNPVAQQGLTWQEKLANRPKKPTVAEIIAEGDARKAQQNTQVDNTKVSKYNDARLFNPNVRNKTDQEIAQEREARIQASVEAQKTPYTKENWRQQLAAETAATGDKLRRRLEPNFFDDYLNPAAMIGNMASNLGQAPLQAQQSDSVMPYVTAIGAPLATGALAGIGAKTTGQFANNIVNPLAGTGELAKGVYNKGINFLENNGIRTSVAPELREGLRTNGLTFNGVKRETPINNYQRTANEDVDRLFKEFPELEQIGSKEDYIKHLESIYPETNQPGIFYRGSKNQNLNPLEWEANPSGGNNLGQGFYFTPDPFKAEKYGKEMKALLNIENPTYTSIKLNSNALNMPSGIMTKDLVKDGSALISIENPNRDLFTGMGNRDEGYIHKYTGTLNEQGYPTASIPYPNMPDFKDYSKIDELAVPNTSQIHILGSDADKEIFKKYVANLEEPKKLQQGGQQKFTENELAFLSEIAIKDNEGYWNKNNQGRVVEIEGNKITMEGVDQDLIGIGIDKKGKKTEKKLMKTGKNYNFDGAIKVVEIPFFKK